MAGENGLSIVEKMLSSLMPARFLAGMQKLFVIRQNSSCPSRANRNGHVQFFEGALDRFKFPDPRIERVGQAEPCFPDAGSNKPNREKGDIPDGVDVAFHNDYILPKSDFGSSFVDGGRTQQTNAHLAQATDRSTTS
jgi:hypothetical protein